jgi:hypothetical protein
VKTVILLSDGITQQADFKGLSDSMVKAGINISRDFGGIAIQQGTHGRHRPVGQGPLYMIDSYERVPQIFIKETELALGKTLQEQPFLPILKKNVSAFKGIDFATAPRLLGFVVTKAKPTAEILLPSPGPTIRFSPLAVWSGQNGYLHFRRQGAMGDRMAGLERLSETLVPARSRNHAAAR